MSVPWRENKRDTIAMCPKQIQSKTTKPCNTPPQKKKTQPRTKDLYQPPSRKTSSVADAFL